MWWRPFLRRPTAKTKTVNSRRKLTAGPRPKGEPPKWKLALLTVLGLYPLVLWLFPYLASLLSGLKPWLSKLLTLLLVVPLMMWG
jgi:antibiotic biosynthesis monooxygenase (ABM) superfamily enzyme